MISQSRESVTQSLPKLDQPKGVSYWTHRYSFSGIKTAMKDESIFERDDRNNLEGVLQLASLEFPRAASARLPWSTSVPRVPRRCQVAWGKQRERDSSITLLSVLVNVAFTLNQHHTALQVASTRSSLDTPSISSLSKTDRLQYGE